MGGGIACDNSSSVIENCTITRNSAGSSGAGGGIYIFGSLDAPTIFNTIVQGNTGQGGIFFDGAGVNAFVTYSDFHGNGGYNFYGNVPEHLGTLVTENNNGDSCDIFYNIFLNPMFSAGYYLQSGSPCIDAGGPNSPLDPDSTIADIGAFYFDQLGVTNDPRALQPNAYALLPPYPNPFNSVLVIPFTLPVEQEVRINVYNILGQKVQEWTIPPHSSGSASSGVEFRLLCVWDIYCADDG